MDRDPLQRNGTVFGPFIGRWRHQVAHEGFQGTDWTPRSLVLEWGAKEVGRAKDVAVS